MSRKAKKNQRQVLKVETPKKVMGYTVANSTTERTQYHAMRESDIETGGGSNIRHQTRASQ